MKLWSCVLIVGLSASAGAQTAAPPPTLPVPADQMLTAANGVAARCMARATTKHDGHDWSFVVPVPSASQADFTAKGFVPAACGPMTSRLADHKRFVCEIAKGNDAVQARTEQVLGIDARKLCAAVTALLPDTATTQAN